jgi:hypothetical protein
MEMEEKIKICKICKNKKFTEDKGIVCGLTNEKPAFEDECPDFKIDQVGISNQFSGTVQSDDELETGFKILSFCIPLAGIILYFTHKEKYPRKSSQACSLAWWGIGVSVVINIIYFLIIVAAGN